MGELVQAPKTTAIRLLMDDDVYQRVKHEAVNERCSANAWIRAAIAAKLDGTPDDDGMAELYGAWASLNDEGRVLMLQASRVLRKVGEYRRAPEHA